MYLNNVSMDNGRHRDVTVKLSSEHYTFGKLIFLCVFLFRLFVGVNESVSSDMH